MNRLVRKVGDTIGVYKLWLFRTVNVVGLLDLEVVRLE